MAPVLEAVEIFVVVAHGMDLGLHMTQFVDRLHLRGYARTDSTKLATDVSVALVSLIFERGNTGQEDFDGVDVTRIRDV